MAGASAPRWSWGVLGAWLGFLVGAIPGLLIDVVTNGGGYVALLGHAGALAGAYLGLRRFGLPRPAGDPLPVNRGSPGHGRG